MNLSQRKEFTEALIEYSPHAISRHLRRANDGTVYFDRVSQVHTSEDESKFLYVLNRYYLAGYKDIENLTIYLDIDGDVIAGGTYHLVEGRRISKVRLISTTTNTPYTYTEADIMHFKDILMHT